jgi:D-amino-acid dehydrogenase
VRVIVIGGGAVGLCVAESLASRGAEVCVFERGRCGAGASAGNAGWITPSLSIPVAAPGVIATSLRWLINPSGPLWIRPSLTPTMLDWLARFVASCSRATYRRGLTVLQRAGARAGPAFERLAARGVRFELHDDDLVYPAFDTGELHHLWRVVDELREGGAHQAIERLSREETVAAEPALDPTVLGGVIARDERRVRPESLTSGLKRALASRHIDVLENSPVSSLTRDRAAWRVAGTSEVRSSEHVVIASGVESTALLAALGVRLPLVAAKGYSRTYLPESGAPKRPLYLEGPKVSISVFDHGVRVSGTLELGARTLSLSSRRLQAITSAARRALPRWRMASPPSDWAGMRSLSPDGLPFIGGVPGLDGLYLATGHATLGITLAPLTGELLAAQLLDGTQDELLGPFDPARAVRPRRSAPAIGHASRMTRTEQPQPPQED